MHSFSRRTLLISALLVMNILVGCEPDATPVALIITPTTTPVPIATIAPPTRYAFTDNTRGFIKDMDEIERVALVEQLSDDGTSELITGSYDMIVAFGDVEGWQQSPQQYRAGLAFNTDLAPLDDDSIRDFIKASIQPQAIADATGIRGVIPIANASQSPAETIRTALANIGYPDGFAIRLTGDTIPAQDVVLTQLQMSNFDATFVDNVAPETVQMTILFSGDEEEWAMWQAEYGEDNILPLYTLPISYRLTDGIAITFTQHGLPVPINER